MLFAVIPPDPMILHLHVGDHQADAFIITDGLFRQAGAFCHFLDAHVPHLAPIVSYAPRGYSRDNFDFPEKTS